MITMRNHLSEPEESDHLPWTGHVPYFIETVQTKSWVDAYLTAVLMTDDQADEVPDLAEEYGVTSFKMYMHLKPGPERVSKRWYAGGRIHGLTMEQFSERWRT